MRLFICTVCLISGVFLAPATQPAEKPQDHKAEVKTDTQKNSVPTAPETKPDVISSDTKPNATTNATEPTDATCSALLDSLKNSGLAQNCTAHSDCMGACCTTSLLAHDLFYNFSVLPCNEPSVNLTFKILDLANATYQGNLKRSSAAVIPHGNMSYAGFSLTESNVQVILEKVVDVTHFRLDFGVDYRVLAEDPIKSLFSHTLVPMLSFKYSEQLCVKPTQENVEKIWGVIPKEYVDNKTTLALIVTSACLVVVLFISLVYFIAYRRRGKGFYRTYVSTDENRHLTKGNDGFEPLDDSDID